MDVKHRPNFAPDYAVPPGATVRELLETLDLTQSDLAERTGRPKKTINEIIQGKAAITPDTALQFEHVLGVHASFWNNLETAYRARLARAEERARLSDDVPWLSTFPIKEMGKLEWIKSETDRVDMVREILTFFGVASASAWTDVWDTVRKSTALRQGKSQRVDFGAITAWLRKGELEGRTLECAPYDPGRFRDALRHIRTLTTTDPGTFCREIQKRCAAAGVAVVFVPELPRLRLFGAARWLSPEKALIQLSLYYKSDDQLWFSFFHEAAHVLLHGRREIFVDSTDTSIDKQEREANRFASDYLIPPDQYSEFVNRDDFARAAVVSFASAVGITPGIVVGRLQHDKLIGFNELNDLRRRLQWATASSKR
jgi:HTH-type transcriptional regulator / antitoxin HigA